MFVMVSYDVIERRTEKFRKLLNRYLVHEQNSVFCGLIGKSSFQEMEKKIEKILKDGDRVLMLICENRLNMEVRRMELDSGRISIEKKSVVL